ncbi:MAG: hypothetical protein R3C59_23220 [Planctomycetaceae bacterium]
MKEISALEWHTIYLLFLLNGFLLSLLTLYAGSLVKEEEGPQSSSEILSSRLGCCASKPSNAVAAHFTCFSVLMAG